MTDAPSTAPALDDLLADSPSNWGKWGPEDEVGSLNYLGPEQVLATARLVRSGKVFTLERLIGDPNGDPVWPGRTPAERTQILDESRWDSPDAPQYPGGLHYADDRINAFLQGSTQYDGLGHVWYGGKATRPSPASGRGPRPRPRSSSRTAGNGWPPTSTRGRSS